MGGLMAGADAVMNISAGYSRRINDELTVGGRVNFKGGLARANMNYDRLNVTLNGEKWAVDAGGNLALSLNGLDVPTDAEGYVDMDRLDASRSLRISAAWRVFGLTFDIGAEYVWMERFKFSAAILNLGFMNWSEKHTFVGRSEAWYDWWECATISIRRRISGRPSERSRNINFDEFAKFKEASGRARTEIFSGLRAGCRIRHFRQQPAGCRCVVHPPEERILCPYRSGAVGDGTPMEWFTASLSWSVGNYKNIGDNFFNSFGFAFNFHTGWINFFAGTDFLMFKVNPQFIPVGQKVFNITVRPLRSARPFAVLPLRKVLKDDAAIPYREYIARGMSGRGIPGGFVGGFRGGYPDAVRISPGIRACAAMKPGFCLLFKKQWDTLRAVTR